MIVHTIKCGHNGCTTSIELTNIQFADMDSGMMGFLNCPGCGRYLLPQHHTDLVKPAPVITQREVEGEDPGWT